MGSQRSRRSARQAPVCQLTSAGLHSRKHAIAEHRWLTCMIHPMMKTTKPRFVPFDAFDTAVDSRNARLIIAS